MRVAGLEGQVSWGLGSLPTVPVAEKMESAVKCQGPPCSQGAPCSLASALDSSSPRASAKPQRHTPPPFLQDDIHHVIDGHDADKPLRVVQQWER